MFDIDNLCAIIYAGGPGKRLFPYSHPDCQKPYCHLGDNRSFIQRTVSRFLRVGIKPSRILAITSTQEQSQLAKASLNLYGLKDNQYIEIPAEFGYPGTMAKAAEVVQDRFGQSLTINSPSDQIIRSKTNSFVRAIGLAAEYAQNGRPNIIGIKTKDIATVMQCGNAHYLPEGDGYKIMDFTEKPDQKTAELLISNDSSACNTGINLWFPRQILEATKGVELRSLTTDKLMSLLGDDLSLTIGDFEWHDCGTLKSLYNACPKTQLFRNVELGEGKLSIVDCTGSLFYTVPGIRINAKNIYDTAIVANRLRDKYFVAIVSLEQSHLVRELADAYLKDSSQNAYFINTGHVSYSKTNETKNIQFGFVGIDHFHVFANAKAHEIEVDITPIDKY